MQDLFIMVLTSTHQNMATNLNYSYGSLLEIIKLSEVHPQTYGIKIYYKYIMSETLKKVKKSYQHDHVHD